MLCDRSGRARCGANWQLRLSPATSMIRSRSICQSMSSVAEAGEASRSRSSRRGCAWWRRAPIIAAPCAGPTRRCSSGETRRCVIGGARQRAHRRAAHPTRVVVGRSVAGVTVGTRQLFAHGVRRYLTFVCRLLSICARTHRARAHHATLDRQATSRQTNVFVLGLVSLINFLTSGKNKQHLRGLTKFKPSTFDLPLQIQNLSYQTSPNILVLYHQECKQSRCWVTNAARGGGAPSLP